MKTNQNLSRLEGKRPASLSRSVCCPQGRDISRVIENNIIPRIPTLRDDIGGGLDTNSVCGMTSAVSGFTLIELLVVVLIIGILAAVALPQYQKAVLKAKSSNLLTVMETIRRAEEVYYLENGTYTRKWNELITFPSAGNWDILLLNDSVLTTSTQYPGVRVYFYYAHSSDFPGRRACYAKMDNPQANQFCQAISGHSQPDTNNGPGTHNLYYFPKGL